MILRINYCYGSYYQTSSDLIRLKEGDKYVEIFEQWLKDVGIPKGYTNIDYELRNRWPNFDIGSGGGQRNTITNLNYNPD